MPCRAVPCLLYVRFERSISIVHYEPFFFFFFVSLQFVKNQQQLKCKWDTSESMNLKRKWMIEWMNGWMRMKAKQYSTLTFLNQYESNGSLEYREWTSKFDAVSILAHSMLECLKLNGREKWINVYPEFTTSVSLAVMPLKWILRSISPSDKKLVIRKFNGRLSLTESSLYSSP